MIKYRIDYISNTEVKMIVAMKCCGAINTSYHKISDWKRYDKEDIERIAQLHSEETCYPCYRKAYRPILINSVEDHK